MNQRRIRILVTDPEATDSSSDDEEGTRVRNSLMKRPPKQIVHEIILPKATRTSSFKRKHFQKNIFRSGGCSKFLFPEFRNRRRMTSRKYMRHLLKKKKGILSTSKNRELQDNQEKASEFQESDGSMLDDVEKQIGGIWMGQWVRIPGGFEAAYSLELGIPIVDNYGFLLGEFSRLDDLNICSY